jgi:hypothetical protein
MFFLMDSLHCKYVGNPLEHFGRLWSEVSLFNVKANLELLPINHMIEEQAPTI